MDEDKRLLLDSFGVPKHSDLEPLYLFAKGNGKSASNRWLMLA